MRVVMSCTRRGGFGATGFTSVFFTTTLLRERVKEEGQHVSFTSHRNPDYFLGYHHFLRLIFFYQRSCTDVSRRFLCQSEISSSMSTIIEGDTQVMSPREALHYGCLFLVTFASALRNINRSRSVLIEMWRITRQLPRKVPSVKRPLTTQGTTTPRCYK